MEWVCLLAAPPSPVEVNYLNEEQHRQEEDEGIEKE